eukprot:Nk52_evm2s356 gene=Nk52_evmTU2s356
MEHSNNMSGNQRKKKDHFDIINEIPRDNVDPTAHESSLKNYVEHLQKKIDNPALAADGNLVERLVREAASSSNSSSAKKKYSGMNPAPQPPPVGGNKTGSNAGGEGGGGRDPSTSTSTSFHPLAMMSGSHMGQGIPSAGGNLTPEVLMALHSQYVKQLHEGGVQGRDNNSNSMSGSNRKKSRSGTAVKSESASNWQDRMSVPSEQGSDSTKEGMGRGGFGGYSGRDVKSQKRTRNTAANTRLGVRKKLKVSDLKCENKEMEKQCERLEERVKDLEKEIQELKQVLTFAHQEAEEEGEGNA